MLRGDFSLLSLVPLFFTPFIIVGHLSRSWFLEVFRELAGPLVP